MSINKLCGYVASLFFSTFSFSCFAESGATDVHFSSSITSASCDVALYDENKTKIDSNTLVVPSLTTSETKQAGALGEPTPFYIGPDDTRLCDTFGKTKVSVSVLGASTNANPSVLKNTNASGPQNIGFLITDKDGEEVLNSVYDYPYSDAAKYIPYDVSLFNIDGVAASGGLVSGVAVFTTSYM
ncbi:type 1 fimbrial protein [Vibrio cholerae]|nr:type 1 fimbrial protein [Vibrio cholerae]HAS3165315.1 type 1 fimbrial protein [Vibrio cholerae]